MLLLLLYNSSGQISAPLSQLIDNPSIFTVLNKTLSFNCLKAL